MLHVGIIVQDYEPRDVLMVVEPRLYFIPAHNVYVDPRRKARVEARRVSGPSVLPLGPDLSPQVMHQVAVAAPCGRDDQLASGVAQDAAHHLSLGRVNANSPVRVAFLRARAVQHPVHVEEKDG